VDSAFVLVKETEPLPEVELVPDRRDREPPKALEEVRPARATKFPPFPSYPAPRTMLTEPPIPEVLTPLSRAT